MVEDKLLIQYTLDGDMNAFRMFVERHHKRVVHICHSFVNHSHDAEDVAQEVFVEVYRSLNSYRGEAAVSTWLYRLSVNKSLDHLRAINRQKRGKGLIVSVEREDVDRLSRASVPLPLEIIESKEREEILRWGIDQLPERQRTAIVLSKLKELSQQEVAEVMGTSISSVESLLVRGKKRLKEILMTRLKDLF